MGRARRPAALAAAALVLVAAAPAGAPDLPVRFVSVDDLKAWLDAGTRVDVIDVRSWAAYEELHIRGARSMPLRSVERRAHEISRTGRVVFY